MKVILQMKHKDFSATITNLFDDVIVIDEDLAMETVSESFIGKELLFLDQIPLDGFSNVNAKVVVVATDYNQDEEFLAARAGARGFITGDISGPQLLKVIGSIAAGEYWMSRVTIARVFEEYTRECYQAEKAMEHLS